MGNVKEEYDRERRKRRGKYKGDVIGDMSNPKSKQALYAYGRGDFSFKNDYISVDKGSDEHKKMQRAEQRVRKAIASKDMSPGKKMSEFGAPHYAAKEIKESRKKADISRKQAEFFKHTIKGKQ